MQQAERDGQRVQERAPGKRAVGLRARLDHGIALSSPQLLDARARRAQRRERLGVARSAGVEARRIDRNDAEATGAHGAHQIGGPRRDDLDALGGDARQQLAGRTLSRRPGTREQSPHRCALEGANRLALASRDDQPYAPGIRVRLPHQCIGGGQRELEAGVRGTADLGRGASVQDDGELIAGRVVQLLDHETTAVGRRGPVHPAQRLARLVLAHAMQLVTAAAQPVTGEGDVAVAVEHRLGELERRGEHRQRRAAARDVDPPRKAERVLTHELRGSELEEAALERAELVGPAQDAQAAGRVRPQRTDGPPAGLTERRAPAARALQRPQLHEHSHTLTRVGKRRERAQRDVRAACQAHPGAREQRGRHERATEQRDLLRAEQPREDQRSQARPEQHAPARAQRRPPGLPARARVHSGTGTRASSSSTTEATSAGAPAAGSSRCASASRASSLTSSGST